MGQLLLPNISTCGMRCAWYHLDLIIPLLFCTFSVNPRLLVFPPQSSMGKNRQPRQLRMRKLCFQIEKHPPPPHEWLITLSCFCVLGVLRISVVLSLTLPYLPPLELKRRPPLVLPSPADLCAPPGGGRLRTRLNASYRRIQLLNVQQRNSQVDF